ncbi:hypothetical protein [Bradyrhizobium sp. BTAi1]|uniref:hypothetical protein n=1 Tax=Bradyrhizobium sp. (strain BTAi1 / ATCC BAA-1182) TaxID=288000 RepID=UPI0002D5F657|nr:hypothetical protein [Bradyrhizobium sp. BTAi1]
MITRTLIAIVAAAALAVPAMAQSTDTEKNGHHYNGGPKTEVPHHMGKKETDKVVSSKETVGASGGHHYTGGPATSSPHHMGDKK